MYKIIIIYQYIITYSCIPYYPVITRSDERKCGKIIPFWMVVTLIARLKNEQKSDAGIYPVFYLIVF